MTSGYNKTMNSTVSALRAITAVTMRRILVPVMWVVGLFVLLVYLCVIYLTTQIDPWWALLFILLVPASVIVLLISAGLWIVSGKLLPSGYSRSHKKEIVAFTDKIMRLFENSKTPYPIHLFLIGKDVLRGKESKHVREVIDDSKSLRRDFEELRKKL